MTRLTLLIELERLIEHNSYLRERISNFQPEPASRQGEASRGNGQEHSRSSLQTGFEIPHIERGSKVADLKAAAYEKLANLDKYLGRLQKQNTKMQTDNNYNTEGNLSTITANQSQFLSKVCTWSPRQKWHDFTSRTSQRRSKKSRRF